MSSATSFLFRCLVLWVAAQLGCVTGTATVREASDVASTFEPARVQLKTVISASAAATELVALPRSENEVTVGSTFECRLFLRRHHIVARGDAASAPRVVVENIRPLLRVELRI